MIRMMAETAAENTPVEEILSTIEALRVHFDVYFDRGWLAMIIDDLPIDFTTLREVRQLVSVNEVYPEDLPTIRYGARQLQQFALDLRRHLLPVLRERLGISRLLARPPRLSENERTYRRLLCATFPNNLSYLEELSDRLTGLVSTSDGGPNVESASEGEVRAEAYV